MTQAAHYREMANDLRRLALFLKSTDQHDLLLLAGEYERLAEFAESHEFVKPPDGKDDV